jgi:hypothetical protein
MASERIEWSNRAKYRTAVGSIQEKPNAVNPGKRRRDASAELARPQE